MRFRSRRRPATADGVGSSTATPATTSGAGVARSTLLGQMPAPLHLLCFDLDGTIVETERLKGRSYALAARDLAGCRTAEIEAAYADVVGQSREAVARALVARFGLEDAAHGAARNGEAPWETLVRVRLGHYDALLSDADTVRAAARPEANALVRGARDVACRTALVTTSTRGATDHVLATLDLDHAFDTIVTADDVARTKPDPEAYRIALGATDPATALTVEDSAVGVEAAIAAGIRVAVVPTPITRDGLAEAGFLTDGAGGGLVRVVERGDLVEAVRAALAGTW